MKKKLHVFAVDDHEAILDGYNFMFENIVSGHDKPLFTRAFDCESAFNQINDHAGTPFDIALIDYSIPAYSAMHLQSGQDIALLVRKTMPNCKIVVLTMHREVSILSDVLLTVNPEAFINKSDCNIDELCDAFTRVLNGDTYYSKTIVNYSNRKEKGITLEDIDVRIIVLLSKGIKNKNLSKYIPLTDSIIATRKHQIKKLLKVEGDDKELIHVAKSQGYI